MIASSSYNKMYIGRYASSRFTDPYPIYSATKYVLPFFIFLSETKSFFVPFFCLFFFFLATHRRIPIRLLLGYYVLLLTLTYL